MTKRILQPASTVWGSLICFPLIMSALIVSFIMRYSLPQNGRTCSPGDGREPRRLADDKIKLLWSSLMPSLFTSVIHMHTAFCDFIILSLRPIMDVSICFLSFFFQMKWNNWWRSDATPLNDRDALFYQSCTL